MVKEFNKKADRPRQNTTSNPKKAAVEVGLQLSVDLPLTQNVLEQVVPVCMCMSRLLVCSFVYMFVCCLFTGYCDWGVGRSHGKFYRNNASCEAKIHPRYKV